MRFDRTIRLVCLLGALAGSSGVAGAELVGLGGDGAEQWRIAPDPEPAPGPAGRTELQAGPWHPPFPDLDIPLLDGGVFRPVDARGDVLLLDFWASWCEPCLREMPKLQQLYEARHGRGLQVVTVNAGEPRAIALDYLDALGVTAPAGTYDGALQRALPIRSLPTLLLVDPDGRIRQKWGGYSEGLIDQVAERVEALLDPDSATRETVAEVYDGHGRLRIGWARRTGAVAGLAVVELSEDDAQVGRVIAATDRELVVLDPDGEIVRRTRSHPAAGLLRPTPPGSAELLYGFRPGGRRIVRLDAELTATAVDVPSYVLDLAVGPEGPWAATIDGVLELGETGWNPVGEAGETRAVEAGDEGLAALRAPATLESAGARRAVPIEDAWRLTRLPDGGVAVGDGSVTGLTTARLRVAGGPLLVVTTLAGTLALVDPTDGRVLHRSVWPRLGPAAVGDADGDGVDELYVGAGSRMVQLEWGGADEPDEAR